MPRPNAAARLQGIGGGDVFHAVRSYVRGQVQFCDIVSPDANMAFFGCVVLNAQANRISAPSGPWQGELDPAVHPLVVVMYRSLGRTPIVIAKLDNPDVTYTSSRPAGGSQSRQVTNTTLDDVAIVNDNSRIVLMSEDNGGDVVIEPDRNLSVQLSSGVARITRSGGAPDGPYLAGPARDRDAAIVSALNTIIGLLRTGIDVVEYVNGVPVPIGRTIPLPTLLELPELNLADIRSAVLRLSSETAE